MRESRGDAFGYKYNPGAGDGSVQVRSLLPAVRHKARQELPTLVHDHAVLPCVQSSQGKTDSALSHCLNIIYSLDLSAFKIAPNGNQTFSCLPLWILEDLKTYIKKSANRKGSASRRKVVFGDQCCHVIMKDDRSNVQSGPIRVAVIGSSEVGKSAFTVRYLTKRFIGEYRSDTGEFGYL